MEATDVLMKRAAAFIARRAHSRGELRRKLSAAAEEGAQKDDAKIYSAAEIETVLDRLERLNLLNDAEYAYNFAFSRIHDSGWGEEKVREALMYKYMATSANPVDKASCEKSEVYWNK